MQQRGKANFAYHALEARESRCNACTMRIRLKEHRARLGFTLEEMEEHAGFSRSQLSRWEAGESNIPSGRLPDLARAYRCRVSDIFEDDGGVFVPLGPTLYVKGDAAAGEWLPEWEKDPSDWIPFNGRADVTAPLKQRFGVRVKGDSMNEVYPDGTILECVSFLADMEITNGRRVIVRRRRNGDEVEVTVKEYFRDESGVEWLVPRSRNPAFQAPIRADQQEPEVDEVQVIGLVVGSYRPE